MAAKKSTPQEQRDERKKDARRARRLEEGADLSSAVTSFNSALDLIGSASRSLARGSKALDASVKASSAPSLVRYGVAARLRPAVLLRAVSVVHRDLQSRLRAVRAAGLTVPDSQEKPYAELLQNLTAVSEAFGQALLDFEKSLPDGSGKGPRQVRDLVSAAARASVFLGRLTGKGRTTSSVHAAAVAADIASSGDVSFY